MKLRRYQIMNIVIVCIVAVLVVILDGIWFNLLSEEIASKILATAAVVGVAAGLVYAVFANIDDDKKKSDDNYLN